MEYSQNDSGATGSPVRGRRGWRVKVYRLDAEGKWLDEGTGMVQCIFVESLNNHALQVISDSENDPPGKVILESGILSEDVYQLQGKMIITWNEPETNVELALSFEDTLGCEDIWEQLCGVQGRVSGDFHGGLQMVGRGRVNSPRRHASDGSDGYDVESTQASVKTRCSSVTDERDDLPPPTVENLEIICEQLVNASPLQREIFRHIVISPVNHDTESLPGESMEQESGEVVRQLEKEHCSEEVRDREQDQLQNRDKERVLPGSATSMELVSRESVGHIPDTGTKQELGKEKEKSEDESKKDNIDSQHGQTEGSNVTLSTTSSTATYLGALLALLPKVKEDESNGALFNLFSIIRTLILYNEQVILEIMLSDEYFEDVVAVLEHDPEITPKPDHLGFLRSKVGHKMVVPIEDPEVLHRIHESFRIRFLRDVLLPRALDENSRTSLVNMETANGFSIATALHSDPEYLPKIFSILRGKTGDKDKRSEGIATLQELCTLAKKMQAPARNAFYRSLVDKGENFFGIFEPILADPSSCASDRLNIGDILKLSLLHDPAQLRSFLLEETSHPVSPQEHALPVLAALLQNPTLDLSSRLAIQKGLFAAPEDYIPSATRVPKCEPRRSLLAQLLVRLVYDEEAGMQAQASEVLRNLLDPETMEVNEKDRFLTLFYDLYIQWLVLPLELIKLPAGVKHPFAVEPGMQNLQGGENGNVVQSVAVGDVETNAGSGDDVSFTASEIPNGRSPKERELARQARETARVAEHHITDLLSFCVQTHGYRIKYYVLRNNVVSKVLRLLYSSEKYLVLDAIRFARTCIGLKDDFYNRHIIQFDLFRPIFEVFTLNGARNNVINSAVMELLEFVRMENIKTLVSYIVEQYGPVLQKIDYVDTYDNLRQRHESNLQASNSQGRSGTRRGSPQNKNDGPRAFGEHGTQPSKAEEAYFEQEDKPLSSIRAKRPPSLMIDGPTSKQAKTGNPLVPYGTEDDDDEYDEKAVEQGRRANDNAKQSQMGNGKDANVSKKKGGLSVDTSSFTLSRTQDCVAKKPKRPLNLMVDTSLNTNSEQPPANSNED